MKATVFEIKRFAVHDGDGIRTTVFLKGCPLRCVWCHNPEGLSAKPQLAYYAHKCIGCGQCASVCPTGAHSFGEKGHLFDRSKCIACGKCAEACFADALTLYGKEMTVEQLMPILLEDRDFYKNSGGGVTISGGECLMQADFCAELLKRLKEQGVHTAVDTCGFVPKGALDKVITYTDVFLYDIKAYDESVHIQCTGQSNKVILDNLLYLDSLGKKIEIRIPYVPDYNDDQMEKIARFLAPLRHITKIRVLPYHNYAGSKYKALNLRNTLPEKIPTDDEIQKAKEIIKSITNFVVIS
jgi:pyruvate formate lyase activating enzyme